MFNLLQYFANKDTRTTNGTVQPKQQPVIIADEKLENEWEVIDEAPITNDDFDFELIGGNQENENPASSVSAHISELSEMRHQNGIPQSQIFATVQPSLEKSLSKEKQKKSVSQSRETTAVQRLLSNNQQSRQAAKLQRASHLPGNVNSLKAEKIRTEKIFKIPSTKRNFKPIAHTFPQNQKQPRNL